MWTAAAAILVVAIGCKQDARLADARLLDPEVRDATIAGLTLDQRATPEDVTFALLQAIRADLEAGDDLEAREKAFSDQFALAAPAAIHAHHRRAVVAERAHLVDFRESVNRAVRSWAPTVGHYARSFGFPHEEVAARLLRRHVPAGSQRNLTGSDEVHVLLEAADPEGDPNAAVVVKVRLVREQERWRVWWVGFQRGIRHLPSPAPA